MIANIYFLNRGDIEVVFGSHPHFVDDFSSALGNNITSVSRGKINLLQLNGMNIKALESSFPLHASLEWATNYFQTDAKKTVDVSTSKLQKCIVLITFESPQQKRCSHECVPQSL